MYFSEGCDKAIETQYVLAKTNYIGTDTEIQYHSWQELRIDLNKFLLTIQPEVTIRSQNDSIISADSSKNQNLVNIFNNISAVNDLNQQQVMKQRADPPSNETIKLVAEGLKHLQLIDEDLYELFVNTINYIFFADSSLAGGGSSSAAIGCIWVNPKTNWTIQDITELFVHELTHNLLFLDERRYTHYSDYKLLTNPAYLAHSSILSRPRPIDKVVHSFVVACEVLAFRKKHFPENNQTNLHPITNIILENLKKTYASLKELPQDLLTKRAWEIIEKAYLLQIG